MRISTFTTRYDSREDRIGLSAKLADDSFCNFWLTRKIATRLILVLIKELDKSVASFAEQDQLHATQTYFQLEARVSKKNVAPIPVDRVGAQVLIDTVHVRWSAKDWVLLEFCSSEVDPAQLILNQAALRQWIEAVRVAFLRAGWNDLDWPAWVGVGQTNCLAQ